MEKSIQQINELQLDQSELESIESHREELKKASRSNSGILDTFQALNRELVEESILNAIKSLERLEKKMDVDNHLPIEKFYTALEKFSQACENLDQLREKSVNSEKQLVEIEDRYHSIKRICRTHNVELDQIFNLQDSLEEELKSIREVDEKIKEIEKEVLLIDDQYKKETAYLSNERYKFAAKLDKKIEKELKPLKLELAKFKTEIIRVRNLNLDAIMFASLLKLIQALALNR